VSPATYCLVGIPRTRIRQREEVEQVTGKDSWQGGEYLKRGSLGKRWERGPIAKHSCQDRGYGRHKRWTVRAGCKRNEVNVRQERSK